MRGYFGIGAEGLHKPMNLGSLMRAAHAFGASFVFTVATDVRPRKTGSDTSRSVEQVPTYAWATVDDMDLPHGCQLVGIEITDDAIDLPSFRHPARAAYVLGPERGALSQEMLERCTHVVRIPTGFSINLATAGAIVMYDRLRTQGRFPPRPVRSGGPHDAAPPHEFGKPRDRTGRRGRAV
jgi:tRNA G18 (ribose-2'-O)-methylase SpoU